MEQIYILLIILLTIFVIYIVYYFGRSYYYLVYLRQKIFPFYIQNIKLNKNIKSEKNYNKIINALYKTPSNDEIVYLIKYKNFLDSPNVYSMCGQNDVILTKKILDEIINNKIDGCLVEMGVWRGGMCMWMKSILKYYRDNRKIWLFDTFKYFPDSNDFKEKLLQKLVATLFEKMPTVNDVQNNFDRYGLLDNNVNFIQGEFNETVPKTDVGKIALLRMDCDYYESTYLILENYYWKISKGGYIIVDDYNNNYLSCKKAVDDFRSKYNIKIPIQYIKDGGIYWKVDNLGNK